MDSGTIWITGLSGAGKTTTARLVVDRLRGEGRSVIFLDGDELRAVFGSDSVSGASLERDGRLALAMRYARLCRMLSAQGQLVVIATISLFREVHAWNRENLSGYLEVFLDVPVDELRRRDPKGIYGAYDRGEARNVSGLDVPIDAPSGPDMTFGWDDRLDAETVAARICERVLNR
ncbi:adenylyl-sulfate kinase [Minwuia sp.]|uniref:adenylyl-sulfate kinase n=1 Tax=Minwuia sp. TaxID=2493630 RepID=UPI003A926349